MRVVAGTFRGRLLAVPPGDTTRPITDRAKETLFNILGHRFGTPGTLPDVAVLDLFSGPGSLGIEALSRGAATCTFVERDRRAVSALRENISKLGLQDRAFVRTDNAWTLRLIRVEPGYGLMFVDPPYRDATEPARVSDLLERLSLCLAADGLIVFRQETTATPPSGADLHLLRIVDEREIGRMRLLFLVRGQPD